MDRPPPPSTANPFGKEEKTSMNNFNGMLPPRPLTAEGRSSSFTMGRPQTATGLRQQLGVGSSDIMGNSMSRIFSDIQFEFFNEMIVAAENGNAKFIEDAIRSGRDILKCIGMNGFDLMHYACSRGHLAVISVLVKNCFPLNKKNDSGETPLHLAVYNGKILTVELLIDSGADINATNNDNETALFYAARRSMPALVRLLLQRGCNPDMSDKYGDMARDHCDNMHTSQAFDDINVVDNNSCGLTHNLLVHIFSFLTMKDIGKCACVSGKWHRASENEILWKQIGHRRWEMALHSTLGFDLPVSNAFSRRKSLSSRENSRNRLPTGPPSTSSLSTSSLTSLL